MQKQWQTRTAGRDSDLTMTIRPILRRGALLSYLEETQKTSWRTCATAAARR